MKTTFIKYALVILITAALFHSSPDNYNWIGVTSSEPLTRGNETATNQSEWKLHRTINNTSEYSTAYPNNKRTMVWWGEGVFHAYVINNKTGGSRSVISYSNDSGNNWSAPITVFNSSVSNYVMVEIMVHNGELFYVNLERYGSQYYQRHVYAKVVNVTDWQSLETCNSTRIDDDYQGFVGNTVLVGLKDRMILFCQRSHHTDIYYRIYQNGTWAPIRFINKDGESSWPAPVVMNVSGVETLFVYYTYYHNDTVLMVSSTDGGLNWSEEKVIYQNTSTYVGRISTEVFNGRIHLVTEERFGTAVYYASSMDGVNWTNLSKIGTMGYDGAESTYVDLVIEADEDNDVLFVAYDNKTQIEVLASTNNGSSFDNNYTFKNTSAKNPTFCSRGKFLLYNDDSDEIHIRKYIHQVIVDPGIGNQTGNVTGNGNQTGNVTGSGNQTGNVTGSGNQTGNVTGSGNQTGNMTGSGNQTGNDNQTGEIEPPTNQTVDDNQTEFEWENTDPNQGSIDLKDGTIEAGTPFVLSASSFDPDIELNGDNLTFHWFVNGEYFGTGDDLVLKIREPGDYVISVIAIDDFDGYEIFSRIISISDPSNEKVEGKFNSFFFISAVIILIFITGFSLFCLKKKKRYDFIKSDNDETDEIHFKVPTQEDLIVRSGNLPNNSFKPSCSVENNIGYPSLDINRGRSENHHSFNMRLRANMLDIAKTPIPRVGGLHDPDLLLEKAMKMLRMGDISKRAYDEIKMILLARKEIK